MRHAALLRLVTPLLAVAAMACGEAPIGSDTLDATSFIAPAEDSCEAKSMRRVANTASFEELDIDVALDKRAAENIVAEREANGDFLTIERLDGVAYVGASALSKILGYAHSQGYVVECQSPGALELGIISDLDKTVVPPAEPDLSEAPYPGVTRLYQLLEEISGAPEGDTFYVTARQPEGVVDMPAYLAEHDVPLGPIETGVSGIPWVAQPEKVKDVTGILEATGSQQFILFGDSSHRDPEVYQEIIATFPDRIVAGFIHKVNNTVSPHRVEGLHLHTGYHEVAAVLYGLGELTREQALEVMKAAVEDGAELDEAEMEALLDEHAPAE